MRQTFVDRLADNLRTSGYPDYAIALRAFKSVKSIPQGAGPVGCCSSDSLILQEGLSDDEYSVLVRHEILHVLLNHHKVTQKDPSMDPQVWNIASDLEISNFYNLSDVDVIHNSEHLKGGLLIDDYPQFKDMVAEDIYRELMKDPPPKEPSNFTEQEKDQEKQNNPNENQGPQPNLRDNAGEILGEMADLGQTETEKEGDQSGVSDSLRQRMKDSANKAEQNPNESSNLSEIGDLADVRDKGEAPSQQQLSDAHACARGTGMGGIVTDRPKTEALRLKHKLRTHFMSQVHVGKGKTFRRPNKKYPPSSGIIMRGKGNIYKEEKTLGVYVDVSGSMTKEKVKRAIAICDGISKMKRSIAKVHYFSTEIEDHFVSGGGTDYEVVLDHATRERYKAIAIITDDTGQRFSKSYKFDALWIIGVEDGNRKSYSFTDEVKNKHVEVKEFDTFIVLPNGDEIDL